MFDRIDMSEGLECIVCHYWYFIDKNFRVDPKVCNGCHDIIQKAVNVNDVAIVTVKGNDYTGHSLYNSKDEAINLLKNVDLTEKSRTL